MARLPPVTNHYAKDVDDFAVRLNRLTNEELVVLVDMIREGKEGISCMLEEWCRNFDRAGCFAAWGGSGDRERTICSSL